MAMKFNRILFMNFLIVGQQRDIYALHGLHDRLK